MKKQRNRRALAVIRALRSRQEKQSQKIDILCKDMVKAHRHFAGKLARVLCVNQFYEALLCCSTLEDMLDTAIRSVQERIETAETAVFLLEEGGFDIHRPKPYLKETTPALHEWFTRELVQNISLHPRACSLTDMLKMGLQGPPSVLKTVSATAIPLSKSGLAIGFIWVCRPCRPLSAEELSFAGALATGLSIAIAHTQIATKQSLSSKL